MIAHAPVVVNLNVGPQVRRFGVDITRHYRNEPLKMLGQVGKEQTIDNIDGHDDIGHFLIAKRDFNFWRAWIKYLADIGRIVPIAVLGPDQSIQLEAS